MCGTPVGTDAFIRQFMTVQIQKYDPLHERTRSMEDTQAQHLALRHATCCNLNHWLRTVPPDLMKVHAQTYDRETLLTMMHMLGMEGEDANGLTAEEILQCRIHVRLGGLGLTSAEAVMEAAWTGSWALCEGLVAFQRTHQFY